MNRGHPDNAQDRLALALIADAERLADDARNSRATETGLNLAARFALADRIRAAATRLIDTAPVPYVLVVGVGAVPAAVVAAFPAGATPVAAFVSAEGLEERGRALGTMVDGRVL